MLRIARQRAGQLGRAVDLREGDGQALAFPGAMFDTVVCTFSLCTAFAVAIVFLVFFAAWELRTTHPMLQLRLFRDRRFSAASASIALAFFPLFGSLSS
jgi:hypothetical protein